MRIAIATFHKTINYGAVFQAYALQTVLKKMGHEPFLIDNDMEVNVWNIGSWLGSTPQKTIDKWIFLKRGFAFSTFRKKFLTMDSAKFKGIDHLKKNPPKAEVYICGSDQVWNYNYVKVENEQLFWLNFGDNTVKRIGYAPSFGVSELPDAVSNRFSKYIKGFTAIGVREKSAIELVTSLGFPNSTWVIDPTLLLQEEDYRRIESPSIEPGKNPYGFCYHVGSDKETTDVLADIRTYLTNVKNIPFHYNAIGIKTKKPYTYGPAEWLSKMKYSSFVVADSFHALMFSLVYRKKFIVVACRKTRSRLITILTELDLADRAVDIFDANTIETLFNKDIDWDKVEIKINQLRKHALEFLESNIK